MHAVAPNVEAYELTVSPRASIDSRESVASTQKPTPSSPIPESQPQQESQQSDGPSPSIRLLFSLLSRRHVLLLLLPAAITSLIAGGIAPFMTLVVGQAFDVFAKFPLTSPTPADKSALLEGVGRTALMLVGLAVGSFVLGSTTSALWIWVGEINVLAVRKRVYEDVTGKEMAWFDLKMGAGAGSEGESEEGVGAGGLMAKFSRETDDVRQASSLAPGTLLQNLTTVIACLALAFSRAPTLTLVILSAVPLLTFIQAIAQNVAGPLLDAERNSTAAAATRVERAVSSIATVKAFNASSYELSRAKSIFATLQKQARSLNSVWAVTSGAAQFVMMAMFVQGFWFGAKLVREGKVGAGQVMAVFWACLIATSSLQMCIPQMIVLAKGKAAMVALLSLSSEYDTPSSTSPSSHAPSSPTSPTFSTHARPRTLRKLHPSRCAGELALYNVSFSYPSRPSVRVLSNVSLFLPAGETTFVVGGSGSGKSTVAALLGGLYPLGTTSHPTSHNTESNINTGMVTLDDHPLPLLSSSFLSDHLTILSQSSSAGSSSLVFGGLTISENILVALPESTLLTLSEENKERKVEAAARASLLHEWVRDLPNGYATVLSGVAGGEGQGVEMSGGQRQRLALARAWIRDSTILVLDEATSALDPPARLLVSAALRQWRSSSSINHRTRTTIVITHDLSQIEPNDFVYVMRGGRVVEQGYRADLEKVEVEQDADIEDERGEFRRMLDAQKLTGGALPTQDLDEPSASVSPSPAHLVEEEQEEEDKAPRHPTARPLTFGNWMLEAVADLTGGRARTSYYAQPSQAQQTQEQTQPKHKRRPSSIQIVPPSSFNNLDTTSPNSKRLSLPFTPTSAATTIVGSGVPWKTSQEKLEEEDVYTDDEITDDEEFGLEKRAMEDSARRAREGRGARAPASGRRGWVVVDEKEASEAKMTRRERRRAKKAAKMARLQQHHSEITVQDNAADDDTPPAFWKFMRAMLPSVPGRPLLVVGLLACVASGAMTPVFSFLLSRLLFEVSIGAQDTSAINRFGGLVLGIAALDGFFLGAKYFLMETAGMRWTTSLRSSAFGAVLKQDKKWFDRTQNSAPRLAQVIVRDGDDARNLVSVVLAQGVVVTTMLGVGLIWALVRGWQLTLAGFAIAPVFAGVMALQTRLVAKCEVRNKRAREEVARGYYEAIINVRGIRCMSFEPIFAAQFSTAADRALRTGVRGALVEGCTYGVSSGLIYLAEALLFFVGAVLISQGSYTYLQMVEVLNLVVFSVTIGAQLMAFTERIAKAVQATADLDRLCALKVTDTDESKGEKAPAMDGMVRFEHVRFAYPMAPSVPVLKDVSLDITPGECVAIVGASGSGKSTLAALLQRLYEPAAGTISIGGTPLGDVDVTHLRTHVSVVSQSPHLFDASVAENIRYGDMPSSTSDASNNKMLWLDAQDVRRAARQANVHEFIMGLPQGYDTPIGENAALLSGGQAQRLQIARALARPADILVLDECTSALDPENQAAVLETIAGITKDAKDGKRRRTTVMVTHKLQVMQMCDRIVVLDGGEVCETGTYVELMERKGVFATLASGGEWIGE
ncbi:P-loop containing nucleoside triphosphate hydrolase protein [Pholiota conissans]|uniref:P-loop containing nucleoside triphosphate hydrolase protein n=1 Tax=Pholiota conissans TaxID=109636 RepID=A0A9P6D4A2_9AGAR|nr:P-loop containing nucleoside triphosphate hydrolase protein [Pholiota conissans]